MIDKICCTIRDTDNIDETLTYLKGLDKRWNYEGQFSSYKWNNSVNKFESHPCYIYKLIILKD